MAEHTFLLIVQGFHCLSQWWEKNSLITVLTTKLLTFTCYLGKSTKVLSATNT